MARVFHIARIIIIIIVVAGVGAVVILSFANFILIRCAIDIANSTRVIYQNVDVFLPLTRSNEFFPPANKSIFSV